jgi:hypothetical protein
MMRQQAKAYLETAQLVLMFQDRHVQLSVCSLAQFCRNHLRT